MFAMAGYHTLVGMFYSVISCCSMKVRALDKYTCISSLKTLKWA